MMDLGPKFFKGTLNCRKIRLISRRRADQKESHVRGAPRPILPMKKNPFHRRARTPMDASFSAGLAAAPGARGRKGDEAELRWKISFQAGVWERD
jgi:hypothetical protein